MLIVDREYIFLIRLKSWSKLCRNMCKKRIEIHNYWFNFSCRKWTNVTDWSVLLHNHQWVEWQGGQSSNFMVSFIKKKHMAYSHFRGPFADNLFRWMYLLFFISLKYFLEGIWSLRIGITHNLTYTPHYIYTALSPPHLFRPMCLLYSVVVMFSLNLFLVSISQWKLGQGLVLLVTFLIYNFIENWEFKFIVWGM